MKIIRFGLAVLLTSTLTTTALADECKSLWIERNTMFSNLGYCFKSDLGRSVFGTKCTTSAPQLSNDEKARVNAIKARESTLGCKAQRGNWAVADIVAAIVPQAVPRTAEAAPVTTTTAAPSQTVAPVTVQVSPGDSEPALNPQAIRKIQEDLAALGFDGGVPDGVMGPSTRNTIRAWQQANGIEATGYLSAMDWRRLEMMALTAPTQQSTPAPAIDTATAGLDTLNTNAVAQQANFDFSPRLIPQERWLDLETMLSFAGYPTGPVDGIFDNTSFIAMMDFWTESGRDFVSGPNFAFTPEAYLDLYETVIGLKNKSITKKRPAWQVRWGDIKQALERLGCYGPAGDKGASASAQDKRNVAIRCYKIHKGIQPVTTTDDGIDFKEMIFEAGNGARVNNATYVAAKKTNSQTQNLAVLSGMTLLKAHGQPLRFGSSMPAKAYSNLANQQRGCLDPQIIIVLDISRPPQRGAIDPALIKIQRAIWPNGRVCNYLTHVRLRIFAEGREYLDHKMGVFSPVGNDDPGYNIRERALATTAFFDAWAVAHRSEDPAPAGPMTEDRFYATMFRPEIMLAIRDGRPLPQGTSRNTMMGLIYVWSSYVHSFEDYCFNEQLPELTPETRRELRVLRATQGVVYTLTSTNTQTNQSWTKQRTIMKRKFGDLYLALSRFEVGELAAMIGDDMRGLRQDVGNLIIFHQCTAPELVAFEDRLMASALSVYDWVPQND